MRISVVVPFRNAERHLGRCLAALRDQKPFPGEYEVVAVDDRSCDGSASIVRRFSHVRLLASPAPGPYVARNSGIAATDGDVIALTDADCEPASDWLAQIASELAPPQRAVLLGPRLAVGASPALSLATAYERAKDEYVFGSSRAELYYASASNMAVRRAAFERVGGFIERRRGADTLLVRAVAEAFSSAAIRYSPELRVQHLEIRNVVDYYRKQFAYGWSMHSLQDPGGRLLSAAERLGIWRDAVVRGRYSKLSAAGMLAILIAGFGLWTLGATMATATGEPRA